MYTQMTPPLRAKGRYTVRAPFVITDADYICVAIRSFGDMHRDGYDVYQDIYVKAGIVDGTPLDGDTFSFETERLRGINIVSLVDPLGNTVLIPDSFINGYPNTAAIEYGHFIMGVSLGPLPMDIELSAVTDAIIDSVGNTLGVKPEVTVNIGPTLTAPTYEEHLDLERKREAAMALADTATRKLVEAQERITQLETTNKQLTAIIIDNNFAPPQN